MNKNLKLLVSSMLLSLSGFAQEGTAVQKDSLTKPKTVQSGSKEEKNRNIMLNAANNNGPRDVNIGLPSTVGGITIQENDLPVVYYFWPELPTRTWRQSTSLSRTGLLKIGEAAITTGDLGFAVNSYTRLGTDKFQINGTLMGSHFGMLRGDVNVSGPMGSSWYYTAGAYSNFDPNSFDLKFAKYSDRTQIYRAGVTKRFAGGKGEISFLYKYANSASLTNYAPFEYKQDGSVKEYNGFRIGRDSYIVNDGMLHFKDVLTGKERNVDLGGSDIATKSHNFDILGNYKLQNSWQFNFSTRFHYTEASQVLTIPLSIFDSTDADKFVYHKNGQAYNGKVNSMLGAYNGGVPTTSIMSRFELTKQLRKHSWRFGLTEYYYNVDQFASSRAFYYQTVGPNPDKLVRTGDNPSDSYGFYNYNVGSEYHDGFENKLALYGSDDWDISDKFTLTYGINLRYNKLKGQYFQTPRTPGLVFDQSQKSNFDNDWFQLGGSAGAVYKITPKAGLLAEFTYTERNGVLESYSGAAVPNLSKTISPLGTMGVYYNNPIFSLVSQVSYLTRNNYLARLNLVNPNDAAQSEVATVFYDIQTLGWTTDIVANPFKGFNLHYLITFQDPVYKNYNFSAFGNSYSYNDKNVLEVSKVLMEIDPSYTYKKVRLWASFRYFSKQFANQTNALFFAARWETFGGLNYKINDHLDFGLTAVNFLNQTGAKGTINGAELITDASPYYDRLLVGSYIRPFTLEASLNFRF